MMPVNRQLHDAIAQPLRHVKHLHIETESGDTTPGKDVVSNLSNKELEPALGVVDASDSNHSDEQVECFAGHLTVDRLMLDYRRLTQPSGGYDDVCILIQTSLKSLILVYRGGEVRIADEYVSALRIHYSGPYSSTFAQVSVMVQGPGILLIRDEASAQF